MTTDIETVVIGAGAVGLAIASELARTRAGVMVIERHHTFGTETSSRNSEVIHAGIYYPEGSLRAALCVEGRERLYAFAEKFNVPVNRCGKLLVATADAELPQLERIEKRAIRNGVGDLVRLSSEEIARIEPDVRCVAATLSPSTGVIDSHAFMAALEAQLLNAGGEIAYNSELIAVAELPGGGFRLSIASGGETSELLCARLVNAAGLAASRVGNMIGSSKEGYRVPSLHPAKGHYFALSGKAPFRRLIYPMPSSDALGVHLTLDMGGAARFGPDIHWQSDLDYAFVDADGRRKSFAREIKRYWPALPEAALIPAYTGLRPKIYAEGTPPADFAIHGAADHGIPGFIALYGIESPGLTASLAIGAHVARLIDG
ncbi:NAD(P)/FAD-dependent oxidoreductase [Hyphomicrobium sp.]|uniref:NAD(P)/FAD-dependent oxidoreductase n=1 Tax=Hyphomicrobium sp. TaxID=82 RepID=UPI000F979D56|nr:NAD(P)/FAD-dependent oxidoreductase [Hyphomicrobium sp.]RUO97849.1 MAG: NAD(P)/FAD-dependent oxidoreductase [Hyphomicrobium sp.]